MQDQGVYLTPQTQPKNLRRKAVLGVLLLAAIGLFFFVYSRAFIRINVGETKDSKATYTLTNQKTGGTSTIEGKPGGLKKMVAKGSYEVLVTEGETSYYKLVKTGSFLSTTTVEAKLQPEKSRSFVGNNPDSCMNYAQELLYSYNCDGGTESLKVHLAADNNVPTITQPVAGRPGEVPIGGTAQVSGKTFVLVNDLLALEGNKAPSAIYELGPNAALTNPVVPAGTGTDFDNPKQYKIQSYKKGFVLYDDKLSEVLYYENPSAQPEKIKIDAPKDKTLQPFELTAQNDRLAVIYSTASGNEKPDEDQKRAANGDETIVSKGKTIFQVYQNGKTESLVFKGGYTRARLCGQNYICLISGPALTVYDIGGGKQKELFKVNEAIDTIDDGNNLVIFRAKDVLGIDIESQTGQLQYSFGDYITCGSTNVQGGGYVLCVTNSKNTRSGLYIDSSQPNNGSIDKKVLSLLDVPYISAVSVYKSYLYIVPELGAPVYNPATKNYTPDPEIKQKAADDINSIIGEIGIDRSTYNIINAQP